MKSLFQKVLNRRALLYICLTLFAVLLVNILVYSYVKTENAVYYWDISAYWKNSIDLLEIFRGSFREGTATVLRSLTEDYNLLPLLPLLPLLDLFGASRTIFLLSILNLYLVPFAVIAAYAGTSLLRISALKKKIFYTTALLATLFFPPMLAPVLDGRPDAISLVSMALIFLLYVKTRFAKFWHYILLGFLICSMFIFRRYYSFWALGFFASYAITYVIYSWITNNKRVDLRFWKLLKKPVLGLFISGITIIGIMLIGFRDVFIRYLTENYTDLYSAYHLGGFRDQIVLFVQNFGLIFIIPVIIVSVVALKKYKGTPVSWVTIFILLQSIIVFLAFTRTQTFGIHHYYMLTPLFIWSFYILCKIILDSYRRTYWLGISLLIFTIGTLSFASFTGERSNTKDSVGQTMFGLTRVIAPIVRHDIAELHAMATFLKDTMKPSDYVYVLASSHTFNDDIFRNINLPEPIGLNVSGSAHVDKRDGFPNYIFDAQYLLVGDPPQTHLESGSQDVVEYPARLILEGKASNLKVLRRFTLDNNVTVTLYKKTEPYSQEFINTIQTHFRTKYPTYPSLNSVHILEGTS